MLGLYLRLCQVMLHRKKNSYLDGYLINQISVGRQNHEEERHLLHYISENREEQCIIEIKLRMTACV